MFKILVVLFYFKLTIADELLLVNKFIVQSYSSKNLSRIYTIIKITFLGSNLPLNESFLV